jgi:hypothetical protein
MVNKNGAFDKRAPFLRADTKYYGKHHKADFFLEWGCEKMFNHFFTAPFPLRL